MLASPDRLRELFERIDPDFRRQRIEAEKKEVETRFIKAYTDYLSQERYAAAHREIYEEADEDDSMLNAKKNLAEQQEEITRQLKVLAEHLGNELERMNDALEEMKKAGSEKLHETRQQRRQKSRNGLKPVANQSSSDTPEA